MRVPVPGTPRRVLGPLTPGPRSIEASCGSIEAEPKCSCPVIRLPVSNFFFFLCMSVISHVLFTLRFLLCPMQSTEIEHYTYNISTSIPQSLYPLDRMSIDIRCTNHKLSNSALLGNIKSMFFFLNNENKISD